MTQERVERALLTLAEIVSMRSAEDAATLAPIYDRLERELDAMRQTNDVQERARRLINSHRLHGEQ